MNDTTNLHTGDLHTGAHLPPGTPVVVAMSGGVDSCAAALMLSKAGLSVVGVSMQVWDYRKNSGNAARATCCAPADFDDARRIADACGFPYYVFDFEDSFRDAVINPFIQSYLKGYTPNPCLDCNRKVKFNQLKNRALSLGIEYVATGHYAQIKVLPSGHLGLFTSADLLKDQSYFLYALTEDDLKNTLFPVGGMTKDKVRDYLRVHGFEVASKAESQDICFVSTSAAEFVERYGGGVRKGPVVDSSGRTLGTHEGVHHFTVGQRKGLGLAAPHPLYVLQIDAETATVTVGARDELARESFLVKNVNWIGPAPSLPAESLVKVRYRHGGITCTVRPSEDDRNAIRVFFSGDEWSAISPGQAAVFYSVDSDGDMRQLLGGGIIERES